MNMKHLIYIFLAGLILLVVGCGGSGGPSPTPVSTTSPTPVPTASPTLVPTTSFPSLDVRPFQNQGVGMQFWGRQWMPSADDPMRAEFI